RPAAAGGDPCRRDAHGPALHLRLGPGPDLGAAPGLWNPPAPAGRGGSGRLAVGRGAGAGTAMILRQLILAVQFLTRLPTPQVADFRPDDLTRSARWFPLVGQVVGDRKSTRLNSSHVKSSYAVFCLKKTNKGAKH